MQELILPFVDSWGNTSLHLVAQGGSGKHVFEKLMEHGADVNVMNKEGATVLMLACEAGQKEVVNICLRAGAYTSIVDVHGDTCLHNLLHRECDQETLQMLLDHGAPVNSTNKNHHTIYLLACHQENIDIVCALVKAGADPSITKKDARDTNHQYMTDGRSSNMTLQTVMQCLDPPWYCIDFPKLELTESLSFNVASRVMWYIMRHVICNRR